MKKNCWWKKNKLLADACSAGGNLYVSRWERGRIYACAHHAITSRAASPAAGYDWYVTEYRVS